MAASAPPSFQHLTKAQDEGLSSDQIEKNQAEIRKWMEEREKRAQIVLKEAINRNVIFIGRGPNGKSTAIRVLKDPHSFEERPSIFSDKRESEQRIHHLIVEVKDDDRNRFLFNINLIDSFRFSSYDYSRQNAEVVEKLLFECRQAAITQIHVIFFVVTSCPDSCDVEVLSYFLKRFPAENHICILVTKAEEFTLERKVEIQTHLAHVFRDLLKQVTVYFAGAVEKQLYDCGFVDSFKSNFASTCQMREELFGHIFAADVPFELNTVCISDVIWEKIDSV